jgi:hypothetical protein
MLSILGNPHAPCDGRTRRDILQAAGAGLLGLSLPKLLAAEAVSGERTARAKSVIFLFLFGGPSQLETFDMKPEAPDNIRGPFKPTACRTPGLLICDRLPLLAQRSDRFGVIRTMSHSYNDHSGGGHYLQTGKRWHIPIGGGFNFTAKDHPSMGSVVEYLAQNSPGGHQRDLPSYAVLPNMLGRSNRKANTFAPASMRAGWDVRTTR